MLIFLFQMRKYYFSPTMVLDANPSVPYYHLPNPDKPVVVKWKSRFIGESKKISRKGAKNAKNFSCFSFARFAALRENWKADDLS
jgi:hypothetical protein